MDRIRVNVTQDDPIGVQMEYTTNYNKLTNKPSINGVELVGNKTTQDLHIETGTENWELINQGSVQSGEYLRGALIDKDTNNNDFLLKEFILYVWNTSFEGSTGAGTLEINDTNMLTGSIFFSSPVLKFHAKYTGQGYATWNIINNVNLGDGNTTTVRTQRVQDNALNVGLCSSLKFWTASASVKMYFDYCLVGVRANEN